MPTDDVEADLPDQTGGPDAEIDTLRTEIAEAMEEFDEASRRSAEALAKAAAALEDEGKKRS